MELCAQVPVHAFRENKDRIQGPRQNLGFAAAPCARPAVLGDLDYSDRTMSDADP